MSTAANQPKFTSFITMLAGVLLLFLIISQIGKYKIPLTDGGEKTPTTTDPLLSQREKALITIGALSAAPHKETRSPNAIKVAADKSATVKLKTPPSADGGSSALTANNRQIAPLKNPETARSETSRCYYVRNGDTLFGIAQKVYGNGNDWKRITAANKMPENAGIRVGQRLLLPAPPTADHTAWLKHTASPNQ